MASYYWPKASACTIDDDIFISCKIIVWPFVTVPSTHDFVMICVIIHTVKLILRGIWKITQWNINLSQWYSRKLSRLLCKSRFVYNFVQQINLMCRQTLLSVCGSTYPMGCKYCLRFLVTPKQDWCRFRHCNYDTKLSPHINVALTIGGVLICIRLVWL